MSTGPRQKNKDKGKEQALRQQTHFSSPDFSGAAACLEAVGEYERLNYPVSALIKPASARTRERERERERERDREAKNGAYSLGFVNSRAVHFVHAYRN
jgi:hypothetical protein